jgi:diguanylate cyclase (GGDEF)-like protein/PAS domain S-box-containing protein
MLLAILAAWVLLPVAGRFNAIKTVSRYFWLIAGSAAMGIGIWAMHFTSMLVFHLPFPIEYDLAITGISIIPAMLASASSIVLYVSAQNSKLKLHLAALCMAVGIGAMHYLGMEAIEVPARMNYVPSLFLGSIGAAYAMALIGLYAKIRFDQNPRLPRFLGNISGSVILGLAVTSMHFIAMRATYFIANDAHAAHATQHDVGIYQELAMQPTGLLIGVMLATILLLSLIIIGTLVDRHLDSMASSLKQSELRFQRLAETTQMAIFTFNEEGVTYANPALSTVTGYTLDQLLSKPLQQTFGEEFRNFARQILHSSSPFGQAYYEQFEIKTQTGESCWLYFSVTHAEIDNKAACLASACDISEQKRAEISLRRLAYTDQLTHLGNRAMFLDRLQHHLDLLYRRKITARSCVMLLNLDGFKLINDTYGHVQGDVLLQEVARRLTPLMRQCDTIARLGGDEFVILLEEMNADHNMGLITERVLQQLSLPFALGNNQQVRVNTSAGVVALDADTYRTPDQVLHDVDIALQRAKEHDAACWVLYDDELDFSVKRARLLLAELRTALTNKQLQLFMQPIVSASSHHLRGFEALARWQRNDGEWVSPTEFIPLAEENGMITDLTLWALEAATSQLLQWNKEFDSHDYYISVNVANGSFSDERFFQLIANNISKFGIRPNQLRLELTERMLISDNKSMLVKLNHLIEVGCELMIDDFGTGYSSLSYLHRLPVKTLKIDRSFVMNMEKDEGSRSVVKSIIALAKSLKMDVISEGVETHEQARLLCVLGSTKLQGYLFGKPATGAVATQMLAESIVNEQKQRAALVQLKPASSAPAGNAAPVDLGVLHFQ